MRESQFTITVPEHLLAALKVGPQDMARQMRLALAIRAFIDHRLSLGKAAELAGINRLAFMDVLSREGYTVFDYDDEEVDMELEGAAMLGKT